MVALSAAAWGTWTLFLHPTGLPGLVTTPIVFAVMGLIAALVRSALREPRGVAGTARPGCRLL